MIPEDYKPFPEEMEMGDYPDMERSSGDSRSGFIDWTVPDMKRNYGEPMLYHYDITTEQRLDDTTRTKYTQVSQSRDSEHEVDIVKSCSFQLQMWRAFFLYVGVTAFLWYLGWLYPKYPPFAEKHFPSKEPDRKFYTFELKEE